MLDKIWNSGLSVCTWKTNLSLIPLWEWTWHPITLLQMHRHFYCAYCCYTHTFLQFNNSTNIPVLNNLSYAVTSSPFSKWDKDYCLYMWSHKYSANSVSLDHAFESHCCQRLLCPWARHLRSVHNVPQLHNVATLHSTAQKLWCYCSAGCHKSCNSFLFEMWWCCGALRQKYISTL